MIEFLTSQSSIMLWVIFLVENLIVTSAALLFGQVILLRVAKSLNRKPALHDWLICLTTNIINTIITYAGFALWQHGYIVMDFILHWTIITDFVLLILLMDLGMYIFHFIIHKNKFIYRTIHKFHHNHSNPIPIDLFILHPFETIGFGTLWLLIIIAFNFNFYAVIIYLTANVFFGIVGHLGIEILPHSIRNNHLFKYIGTSTFHHNHHLDINHNFGFYTSIWDRILKTYKQ